MINLSPQNPSPSNSPSPEITALLNTAIAQHQAGQLAQAEQIYRQILQQQPQNVDAIALLGVIACQHHRLEDGIALYRQALALRPDHRQARENLNLALFKHGRELIDEAIKTLNLMANMQPSNPHPHILLGSLYHEQSLLDQALSHFQLALDINPANADLLNRIGVVLQQQGKGYLAVHFHERSLNLQPNNVDTLISLGKAMMDQGKTAIALDYLKRALALQPNHAIARYNRAILLLQSGQFQEGFVEYEWRLKTNEFPPCPFTQPLWDGSNLQGKTLLLHAEQGLGDTLQFIRYAPLAAQRGGRVILTCHRPLMRLLSGVPGIDQITPLGTPLPEFHVYAPLLSLPGIFGTTLATVPAQVPYLRPTSPDFTLPRPLNPQAKLKVGIVWAGGNLYKRNQVRSCALADYAPVLAVPQVAFYSLQKGIPQTEIAALAWQHQLQDLAPQLRDMADTAAAIAQLDHVITVDTSVAHLAGALGKPVWVLLTKTPDWRWLCDRPDSPWYPTMRLFRQTVENDWASVMQAVAIALTQQLQS